VVAEAVDALADQLEAKVGAGMGVDDAVLEIVRETYAANEPIVFEGDNYSEEWHAEAERRGLANLAQTPDALPWLVEAQTVEVMSRYGVLSERELEARYEVFAEQYATKVNIEAETAAAIARTMLLPAAIAYLGELGVAGDGTGVTRLADELSAEVDLLVDRLQELEVANANHPEVDDVLEAARYVQGTVVPAMEAVREVADRLEKLVPDTLWPLPKYSEILFIK